MSPKRVQCVGVYCKRLDCYVESFTISPAYILFVYICVRHCNSHLIRFKRGGGGGGGYTQGYIFNA